MYRAIEYFEDLQDNGYAYKVGDIFPRNGKDVSPARISALLSANNKRGKAVIAKFEPPVASVEPTGEKAEDFMNKPAETLVEADSGEKSTDDEIIREAVPKKRSRKNKE